MRIIPALIALAVITAPAAAFPAVGDKAPAVAGADINGKTRTLQQVAGRKGTVLMFFRSASWCPFCKAQLIAMNDKAAEGLASRGYALVGLSYDSPEVLACRRAQGELAAAVGPAIQGDRWLAAARSGLSSRQSRVRRALGVGLCH